MKKYFMIAVMAVAALSANAQDSQDYKKFHITPHWGVGYANLSNNDQIVKMGDFVTGKVGGEFELMATKNLGFSAGVDFTYAESPKKDLLNTGSYKIDDATFSGNLKYSENYTFMNVPVLAQYHVGGFTVKAGVQANILLDANGKVNAKMSINDSHAGIHTYNEGSNSIKDYYNTVSWSVPVGVSYTFKVPVTVGLDCNIPVTSFSKSDNNMNQKFMPVMLTVGYRF